MSALPPITIATLDGDRSDCRPSLTWATTGITLLRSFGTASTTITPATRARTVTSTSVVASPSRSPTAAGEVEVEVAQPEQGDHEQQTDLHDEVGGGVDRARLRRRCRTNHRRVGRTASSRRAARRHSARPARCTRRRTGAPRPVPRAAARARRPSWTPRPTSRAIWAITKQINTPASVRSRISSPTAEKSSPEKAVISAEPASTSSPACTTDPTVTRRSLTSSGCSIAKRVGQLVAQRVDRVVEAVDPPAHALAGPMTPAGRGRRSAAPSFPSAPRPRRRSPRPAPAAPRSRSRAGLGPGGAASPRERWCRSTSC